MRPDLSDTAARPGASGRRWLARLALALACGLISLTALGQAAAGGPMTIKVKNDRLTLALAKAPQVYLAGSIDADAPQRFEAMMRGWQIPTGSDVYLDASGGDIGAGMALGRLFRAGGMVTHLGVLRLPHSPLSAATCSQACAYAYLGGLYRWAPTGTDRFGLPALPANAAAAGDARAYLQAMGIDAARLRAFGVAPGGDGLSWLGAEPMLAIGLANNGRLPLTAHYQPSDVAPSVSFEQVVRLGRNRVNLECRADALTMTASYVVGGERARQLLGRQTRSYFELNHQEILPQQSERAHIVDQALVFSRSLTIEQLSTLISAESLGVWIKDKSGNVRYGFTIGPVTVRSGLIDFYAQCGRILQRQGARQPI